MKTKTKTKQTKSTSNNRPAILNESASLAFNDIAQGGSSDKVYHLALTQSGAYGTYHVTAQYGRRGSALATDNKTKNGALVYDQAKKIFDRVLREKLGKGYVDTHAGAARTAEAPVVAPESIATTPYQSAVIVRNQELLEEIPNGSDALRLVNDERYWMQDKSDGHSRGVVKSARGEMFGLNKTGGRVPLSEDLIAELARIPLQAFQIDAELVGQRLVCRDLLFADTDIAAMPYVDRFCLLVSLLAKENKLVSAVETWEGAANKAAALAQSRAENREGVVFKLKSAPHRAGRNGQHKKFKFVKTASVIAGKPRATGKDSVEIFLIDEKGGVCADKCRVGTVSLIGKAKVSEGDVLEVAYLYAFPSKMMCQARILRVRDDVHFTECTTAQLIFKREENSAAA